MNTYWGLADEMRKTHRLLWDGAKGVLDNDPGCVEWSTPVLHSWEEAKAAWEYGHTLSEMYGLVEEHETIGGGMGHIHVECSDDRLMHAIKTDMFFRPYVAWAFCHPSAIEYCAPHYRRNTRVPSGITFTNHSPFNRLTDSSISKYTDINITCQSSNSNFGTKQETRTLEFRFFNSASTWEEQYRNLAFVQRYVQHMAKVIKDRPVPCTSAIAVAADEYLFHKALRHTVEQQFGKNFDRCAKEFEDFIKVLGLPFEDYESLIEENLRPQFEWGKRDRINLSLFSRSTRFWLIPSILIRVFLE